MVFDNPKRDEPWRPSPQMVRLMAAVERIHQEREQRWRDFLLTMFLAPVAVTYLVYGAYWFTETSGRVQQFMQEGDQGLFYTSLAVNFGYMLLYLAWAALAGGGVVAVLQVWRHIYRRMRRFI